MIVTRTEKIWIDEQNLLRFEALPVKEHNLDDAKINVQKAFELVNGKKHLALIDIRNAMDVSRDARKYYAGEENSKVILKGALLIDNPISSVIGNFFLGLNNPVFPVKLFTSQEKAISWLFSKEK